MACRPVPTRTYNGVSASTAEAIGSSDCQCIELLNSIEKEIGTDMYGSPQDYKGKISER
jgi:hypothetical protein